MKSSRIVLLLEDDRHIALAFRIRLSAAGYTVVLASSAAEAYEAIDVTQPDVAVLDVNLPDGDGIDVMKRLLSLAHMPAIRVVIMTASRQPGLRDKALQAGALAFLEKPFSSEALLAVIDDNAAMAH